MTGHLIHALNRYKFIIAILFIGGLLRFYHLSHVASFEYDDQYNSYLVLNLIRNHHLSLAGPEISFGGMFLGPWHYLYLTPFYLLTKLHPIGGYIGESILGLATVLSYFIIGRYLFSWKTGLLAAFFRAFLINLIVFDRTLGTVYPAEIVSLWFYYFLIKYYQKSLNSFIALSFLAGLMFTSHLLALPLLIIWIFVAAVFRPVRLKIKTIIFSFIAFFIPVSPLVLFEFRHNFVHIIRFLNTFNGSGQSHYVNPWIKFITEINYIFGQFFRIFGADFITDKIGYIIFFLILFYVFKRYGVFKQKFHKWLFCSTFLVIIIYYFFYPRHVPDYYYLSLIPLTVLYLSGFIISLTGNKYTKLIAFVFLSFVVIANGRKIYLSYISVDKSLDDKDKIVQAIIRNQGNQGNFSVTYINPLGFQYGYQYFFTLYNLEPTNNYKPPIYNIIYPVTKKHSKDISPIYGNIGLILPKNKL